MNTLNAQTNTPTKRPTGWLSQRQVRQFECPTCLAYPGELCAFQTGKLRKTNHKARVLVAVAALKGEGDGR